MADRDVVAHVSASTGLSPGVAARVVDDVVAFYGEPTDAFVRRRHAFHKAAGLRNPDIFPLIGTELTGRVVSPPELTERQLRRIVYG